MSANNDLGRPPDAGFGVLPFLAMELVNGEPFTLICATALPEPGGNGSSCFCRFATPSSTHRQAVIRRDPKPANILVSSDGTPKIVDFGIASALHPSSCAQATCMTCAGQPLGTLRCVSPEQAFGQRDQLDTR